MKVKVTLANGDERCHEADTWGFSEGWLHIADTRRRELGQSTEIAAYNGVHVANVELVDEVEAPAEEPPES